MHYRHYVYSTVAGSAVKNSGVWYTATSIKVVPKQSGKVEYEREKFAGSDD